MNLLDQIFYNGDQSYILDVDGTLVSFDTHRVPQSAIEALQQVHESGIKS